VTTEERFHVHEQMIASIERNLGALVEAQQQTEQRVNELTRVVASVIEIQRDTLGMIQNVVNRVEQLTQQGAATDRRLDRLAETVQRFLDSQTGRNGQQ
jgi:ABC-type transporter Mla subunit MlaD